MKLATVAVGATAALITGGLVWLAVREERPASAKPTTTPQPADQHHQSVDKLVDAARSGPMRGEAVSKTAPGPDTVAPGPVRDPSEEMFPWDHGLREDRRRSLRSHIP